jgi:hypothetical protein
MTCCPMIDDGLIFSVLSIFTWILLLRTFAPFLMIINAAQCNFLSFVGD